MAEDFLSGLLKYPIYFLWLMSSFCAGQALPQPVLTLVTGDMVAGFYHSPEQTGIVDNILAEALRRMGYGLKVLTVPTQRSLQMSASGLADGELLRTPAIEAGFPTLLRVPESLVTGEFVVFSREPFDVQDAWESLAGKSVGIIIGMKIIEKKVPKSARISRVKNETQLFSLLVKKRIDYAVFLRDIGLYHLNKSNIKGVVINVMPLETIPAYVYLNPKHAALVPLLTRALREMKRDGTFQEMIEQHLQPLLRGSAAQGVEDGR
ncbi:MAG: transporter substrate-binding domain-containing protein [Porticoccaceae bacterium]|nr:transporter substrate-binding domain-containing protein [Porticoccaceae bacterium]